MKNNKIVIWNEGHTDAASAKNYARELFNSISRLIDGQQLTIEIPAGTDFEEVVESIAEIADALVVARQMMRTNDDAEEEDGYDGWLQSQDDHGLMD